MDTAREISEFLTSRRARLQPSDVGLPGAGVRRVPGLRRTEVAILAGVSVEYYGRLERGELAGASEAVLDAVATALRMDDAERAHLFDLARAAAGAASLRPKRRPSRWTVPPGLQVTLDAITAGPAFVRNGRLDIVAANALARAFYRPVFDLDAKRPNIARFQFLDEEHSREFYPEWDSAADITVAILRTEAGRAPNDPDLQELVGELGMRSDAFRHRWGAHDVRHHSAGVKRFAPPLVGPMTLNYQAAELVGETGLTMTIYTADPGSPSEERLRLLASWTADESRQAASAAD
jgi:transcriptional regulator with XRE-family HTH domain